MKSPLPGLTIAEEKKQTWTAHLTRRTCDEITREAIGWEHNKETSPRARDRCGEKKQTWTAHISRRTCDEITRDAICWEHDTETSPRARDRYGEKKVTAHPARPNSHKM